MEYSVQDIKELMESLQKSKLSKLKIKNGDFSLEIEGIKETPAAVTVVQQESAAISHAAVAIPAPQPEPEYKGNIVNSPIVGTFYASPSPDKEPYVTVGSKVKKGDVLFIIESMKLMNEVTSDYSGTVTEIIAQNEQPVEYGQPILCIE